MDLAERLQEMRKEAGYSQEKLAEMLGISRQALSKWENGQANPDVNNIKKLCEIYDKSSDYILFGKEKTPEIVYQEKIVYKEKKGLKKLYDLPRSFRITLAVCIMAFIVGVVVPALFLIMLDILSLIGQEDGNEKQDYNVDEYIFLRVMFDGV